MEHATLTSILDKSAYLGHDTSVEDTGVDKGADCARRPSALSLPSVSPSDFRLWKRSTDGGRGSPKGLSSFGKSRSITHES